MSTSTSNQPVRSGGDMNGLPGGRRPFRRVSSTRSIAVVAVVAALLGAGLLSVVLFAVGAAGETATSAITLVGSTADGDSLSAPLNAAAIFAAVNPSVVDVTASQPQATETGTGFMINAQGDILTADHVVAGASSISVKLQNGTTMSARVLGQDNSTDVAVLKINPSRVSVPPLALGSTASLSVGDTLAVIGNPFGFDRSLSTGVVSALDRTIQAPSGFLVPHAIQTDAAINPGNSGGPVLDARGAVVGIVDQIATGGSGADSDTGVGFAIPIDVVKAELPRLERGLHVAHAFLGVATAQATASQPGALVQSVAAGTPAAAAGLRAGDLITAVDGTAVRGPSGFVAAIAAHNPGDRITLKVQRGSATVTLTATLGEQPTAAAAG